MWIGFGAIVLVMLAIDLGLFHRKAHAVGIREALIWSAVWILLALGFSAGIYFLRGREDAVLFLTGYIVEKSLSVDNLFVFLLIFNFFAVPAQYQHKVLFWGILGALIMRAIFIAAGIALIAVFQPVLYLFGAFLIFTGLKLLFEKDKEIHPDRNPVLRWFRRRMPVTETYEGDRFLVVRDLKRWATPLLVVLVVVETTDVVFAVDSVPAVLAITQDPYLVYTSNVFAILGLRALFFALAGIMRLFHHLHYGLSLILAFVGIKMGAEQLAHDLWDYEGHVVPTWLSLSVIGGLLLLSVIASLIWPKGSPAPTPPETA